MIEFMGMKQSMNRNDGTKADASILACESVVASRALSCARLAAFLTLASANAWVVALAAMIFWSPARVAAQEHVLNAGGLHVNRGYMSGVPFENIDAGTGSLVVTLTPLVLPGNAGRELRFIRSHNSKHGNAGGRFGISGIPLWVSDNFASSPESRPVNIFTPDGGTASAYIALVDDIQWDVRFRVLMTDSFWLYDRPNRVLYMPDGSRIGYQQHPDVRFRHINRAAWHLDAHGNQVTFEWTDHQLTVRQWVNGPSSAARVVVLTNSAAETSSPTWMPVSMTYDGKSWTFTHPAQSPIGNDWSYEYVSAPLDGTTGLARLWSPYGGRIEYVLRREEVNDPPLTVGTDVVGERKVFNVVNGQEQHTDTWTYTYAIGDDTLLSTTTTVHQSDGSVTTVYTHERVAVPAATRFYDGRRWVMTRKVTTRGGTELEREERSYGLKSIPWFPGADHEADFPVLTSVSITRRVGEQTRSYTTSYCYADADYGDYHRPRRVIEVGDPKVSGPGNVRRVTDTQYAHSPGKPVPQPPFTATKFFLGAPTSRVVTVGVGHVDCDDPFPSTPATRTAWEYDFTAPNPPSDPTGFRTSETVDGITTTFTADSRGNVAKVALGGRNDHATDFTYTNGQVAVIDKPRYRIARDIDFSGAVLKETVARRETAFAYDAVGRLVLTTPPGSNPTTVNYDVPNQVVTRRGDSVLTTTLDGFGRAIATVDGLNVSTRTSYDANGRVTFRSLPYRDGNGSAGTSIEYDGLGRVERERDLGANGQVVAERRYEYGLGTVTVIEQPQTQPRETVMTYEAFGHPDAKRLVRLEDADDEGDNVGNIWNYEYNVRGALTSIALGAQTIRSWSYDPTTHLLLSETHPESGTTTYVFDGATGLLVSKEDANRISYGYTYDTNDRLEKIVAAGPPEAPQQRVTQIVYEQLEGDDRPGSDNRVGVCVGGSLTPCAGGITTEFAHDAANRLESRHDRVDGKDFWSYYTYTGNDQLETITYPTGRTVTYEYDDEDQVVSVSAATQQFATEVHYHPSGGVRSYRAGNGVITQIEYESARHLLSRILVENVLDLQYTHDKVGNVLTIDGSRGSHAFTYDKLDRLKTAEGPSYSLTYTYDAHGNPQWPGQAHETNNPFRLTQINYAPVTFDAGGNLRVAPNAEYTWEPGNLLKQAAAGTKTLRFAYDGDDWRIKKEVLDDVTTYSLRGPNGELLTEWKNTSPLAEARDYIHLGGRLIAGVKTPMEPK